jgi:hypothetical protein
MGQTSGDIRAHISQQRDELSQDLDDLRSKVRSSFDWRTQCAAHPMTMIALAVGGGLVLGSLVAGRRT